MRWLVLLLCCASCVPNVTTTRITRAKDGTVTINSGKDVSIGSLALDDGPLHMTLKGYSANANTEAIKAEGERETARINAIAAAVAQGVQAGIAAAAGAVN